MALAPDDVRERIAKLLGENFKTPAESVTPEATFRGTLGLDSLDVVDFVFFVQQEFDYEAKLHDYRNLHSIKDLVAFVIERAEAA